MVDKPTRCDNARQVLKAPGHEPSLQTHALSHGNEQAHSNRKANKHKQAGKQTENHCGTPGYQGAGLIPRIAICAGVAAAGLQETGEPCYSLHTSPEGAPTGHLVQ